MTAHAGVTRTAQARHRPAFFDEVEQKARTRWEQLEADEELAAPWHQLFRQVQSPRHVISELLQNADDAEASRVSAMIDNGRFIFEHDGIDFDASSLSSLCKFGFSNKRRLHTIGFRGIGFKSTFSLGEPVTVSSPSLSIRFYRSRFTHPMWDDDVPFTDVTRIAVSLSNDQVKAELQRNLDEWANSGASLLFFRHLGELKIGNKTVCRRILNPGPVANSEYVELTGTTKHTVLVIHSEPAAFPSEAIEEIHRERGAGEDFNLPPCQVELVLGLPSEQRLFVVLPTDVRPPLPFSCNAPFIQDPARTRIKDPATSPTNRWLLERLGHLAATSMHAWLRNTDLNLAHRAEAYRLLPKASTACGTFDNDCARYIIEEFAARCSDSPVLLTCEGHLAPPATCCVPPSPLYRVWNSDELTSLFGDDQSQVLAAEVPDSSRTNLSAWNWIKPISVAQTIERLTSIPRPPRPREWERLIELWQFVETQVADDYDNSKRRSLQIIPVEGSDELFPTNSVIRLPKERAVRTADDVKFLAHHVNRLASGWIDTIDRMDAKQAAASTKLRAVLALLDKTGFSKADPWSTILGTATATIFAQKSVVIADAIRLAHIHAQLGCERSESLRYLNRSNRFVSPSDALCDQSGALESMLPAPWAAEHLLLATYFDGNDSCDATTWSKWFGSELSGATMFPLLSQNKKSVYQAECEEFLKSRAVASAASGATRRYQNEYGAVDITDYDFDTVLVSHWRASAKENVAFWSTLLKLFLRCGPEDWPSQCEAKVEQTHRSYSHAIVDGVPAQWVYRLRATKCLPDDHGVLREPAELLLRNSETEALVGVEPFVLRDLDTEATRQLLRALGVRTRPASAEGLLQRIRALATVKHPPVDEVVKWFNAIDRQLHRSDGFDRQQIVTAFQNEALALTSETKWVKIGNVFRKPADDDLPGVTVLHPSAGHLPMWEQFGVAEKPTEDLMVNWVKSLPVGTVVDPTDLKRLKSYLKRFAERIWQECGKWLSIDDCWQPLEEFRYRIGPRQKSALDHLFPRYKALTADLSLLPDAASDLGQDALQDLVAAIELRLDKAAIDLTNGEKRDWMLAFGQSLVKFTSDDAEQITRIRESAERLSRTVWMHLPQLTTTPYIDGVPAGEARSADCAWEQFALLVREKSPAKYADAVIQQLARPFGNKSIADAIRYCIDREPDSVEAYLVANFDLSGKSAADAGNDSPEPQDQVTASDAVMPNSSAASDQSSSTSDPPAHAAEDDVAANQPTSGSSQQSPESSPPLNRGTHHSYVGSRRDRYPRTAGPNRETRNPGAAKPVGGPTLMTEFAKSQGFKWSDTNHCYVRKDGCQIVQARGPFHWEWLDRSGNITWRIWQAEQSLSTGVEFDTEVWEMLKQRPGISALVLRENKTPKFIAASDLIRMTDSKVVGLFPATYRLRMKTQ